MTHSAKQDGFVLVLTMWVLVAVTIAATYFGERVQKSLALATSRQQATDSLIAMSNVRADLLFRLGTTPMSQRGLGLGSNVVALDGRDYQAEGTTLQFQDGFGLMSLNLFGDEPMFRFLGVLGVPANMRTGMIDKLRDYIDEDNLSRLNGAEVYQYQTLGLPPPRNAPLISPMELKQVLGWRDLKQLWVNSDLLDLTSLGESVGINPNTAPRQVLMTLTGMTVEIADAIISRRRLEPVSTALLEQMLGRPLTTFPAEVLTFPSSQIRVTQTSESVPWVLRYNVALAPKGAESPWLITYFYRTPKNVDDVKRLKPSNSPNAPHPPDFEKLPAWVAQAASSPLSAPK